MTLLNDYLPLIFGPLLALLPTDTLYTMWSMTKAGLILASMLSGGTTAAVDLSWHPPAASQINDLSSTVNSTGVYGYIYDSSHTPDENYGQYNWCNMPHVRKDIYIKPADEYKLRYVEIIHRHHKRTPYASNTFPVESYPWNCATQGLFYYGSHFDSAHQPARTYWSGYTSPINPFAPTSGFLGSCQFPQITDGGLDDSWQHGADLYQVYHDLLGFAPGRDDPRWQEKVKYRVTNNQITSQVASQVINGMYATTEEVPLAVQQAGADSLEPGYSCPAAGRGYDSIKSVDNPVWREHLDAIRGLYEKLDDISGVDRADAAWHVWVDHYYDNLSARECHGKPLPCKVVDGQNTTLCVDRKMADEVYRLGHWEYSRLYRDSEGSLGASVASFGVWVGELAANLRAVVEGTGGDVVWRHNVAHDGSLSRLLSVLQIETMVWPGMGSEVVFELYERKCKKRQEDGRSGWFVRVLFGGKTLKSSNPSLGLMDMLSVERLLEYFDGLVGVNASRVKGQCK